MEPDVTEPGMKEPEMTDPRNAEPGEVGEVGDPSTATPGTADPGSGLLDHRRCRRRAWLGAAGGRRGAGHAALAPVPRRARRDGSIRRARRIVGPDGVDLACRATGRPRIRGVPRQRGDP